MKKNIDHNHRNLIFSNPLLIKAALLCSFISWQSPAWANKVTIIGVDVSCNKTCTFSVKLNHEDTGWDHYANRWEVLDLQGNIIATRVLHHPHVNEQPFTRSLSNIKIPEGIKKVLIRAHDSVHKYSDKTFKITLPN